MRSKDSPRSLRGAFAQLVLAELLRRAGARVVTDLDVTIGHANPGALADGATAIALQGLLARLEAALLSDREVTTA